jgi:hypothetical protein
MGTQTIVNSSHLFLVSPADFRHILTYHIGHDLGLSSLQDLTESDGTHIIQWLLIPEAGTSPIVLESMNKFNTEYCIGVNKMQGTTIGSVRFEGFTAATMKSVLNWDIKSEFVPHRNTLRLRYRAQPVNAI